MISPMVTKAASPTVLRRQLGAELRRMRERTQRTVTDVAHELGWSESKLSRVETAHSGIRAADLQRLCELYGTEESERKRLSALAHQARQRGWWEAYGDALPNAYETYIGFEAEATAIFNYEAQVVPGLLQSDEYASAVTIADGVVPDRRVIERRVAVRMARQAVLTRDPPLRLWAILDEAVLRRPIGGEDVMRRQLLRLIEAAERETITIQILPFAVGAHRALAGSFIILEFADSSNAPLVYTDDMTGGTFRSKPDQLRSYWMSFEALRTVALDAEGSVQLMRNTVHRNT
jgi:transcriptional regulator with XRE-family HTH domain